MFTIELVDGLVDGGSAIRIGVGYVDEVYELVDRDVVHQPAIAIRIGAERTGSVFQCAGTDDVAI